MKKTKRKTRGRHLPVIVSRGEDGFYIVQCPALQGCFTQGRTLDEALKNIKEVIELCLEEKDGQEMADTFNAEDVSLHTVTV